MAKKRNYEILGARSFLDAVVVSPPDPGYLETWAQQRRPSDLLRSSLQSRSDFRFLQGVRDRLAASLKSEGIERDAAVDAILSSVLSAPSHASIRARDTGTVVRHASLVERAEDVGIPVDLLVVLDFLVKKDVGADHDSGTALPEVTDVTVHVELLELDEDSGFLSVIQWYMDALNSLDRPSSPRRHLSHAVVVAGDPQAAHCSNTPANWREILEELIAGFEAEPLLHFGKSFNGTIPKNTSHVFRLEPYRGPEVHQDGTSSTRILDVNASQIDFDDLLIKIADALLQELPSNGRPDGSRTLGPGERVFHRKVGASRHCDRLNEGSESPCQHGAAGFVRFDGPKALKGMRRRYSNFEDSWLMHCGRYPNCGMYGVFAAEP